MQRYHDCPQVLREFLIYHENIKGQSPLTISEYYLDLRMFLRFIGSGHSIVEINARLLSHRMQPMPIPVKPATNNA